MTDSATKIDEFFDKAITTETSNFYKNMWKRLHKFELLIDNGWTHKQIVDGLSDEGINVTLTTFRRYLYKMRKKKKIMGISEAKPALATTTNPARDPSPNNSLSETEQLIGYQLEPCIRKYVQVVDGKIIRNFPRGSVMNAEQRQALARLRNSVHPPD